MADQEQTIKVQDIESRDEQVKKLSEQMAEWKLLVLGCSRLMLWEKPLEAAILVAIPTLFFTLLYFLDAGMLTIMSLCGLGFVAMDLGLPFLITYLKLDRNANEGDDKVIFERFCSYLVTVKGNFYSLVGSLRNFRTERRPLFYGVITVLLVSLAWIGACINGICIAYFVTLGLCLYPGIRKHRLLETGFVKALDLCKTVGAKIKGLAAAATSKKQK